MLILARVPHQVRRRCAGEGHRIKLQRVVSLQRLIEALEVVQKSVFGLRASAGEPRRIQRNAGRQARTYFRLNGRIGLGRRDANAPL